ncbi:major facilitator superfamily domain-containing protein [Suillus clintonianus]|uniref:major facilitator superfamily domain-containing protein n=1 Tax=Suillus clintonianus TaxID=1904413 RepID=UPI001B86880C|nr:major facilitator superfamily domain-containing protein [Suillus clintonianus]KAG2157241.1 major facilitator superfamily domain-containing protein [Suillus clintonianus]
MSRRASRNTSVISSRSAYIPQSEELIIMPGGSVDEQNLHDTAHPHRQSESTLVGQDGSSFDREDDEHDEEVTAWKALPWWKRPSPYWLVFATPLASIGFSAVIGPRVEMYTVLACRVHAPALQYEPNSMLHLAQPYSMLSKNMAKTLHVDFNLDEPSAASVSAQPVSLYVPANPGPQQEHVPDRDQCASDPVVQAAVAKLSAVLTTTMGILSCLTTAWWGSLSDRLGRTSVMGISMLGLLANDLTFIVTAFFVERLPGGYWFLILGFALDGVLGGMTTGIAASHAYLADSTHHSDRSRMFSLALGTMFCGVALGPVIGGILIRATGSALSTFYLAAVVHALHAAFMFLVIPESQTNARALGAQKRRQESLERRDNGISMAAFVLQSTTGLFSPLAVLLPKRVAVDGNPLKHFKRDWSLCFLAASCGFAMSLMGLVTHMLQYAAGTFKWSSETISYYVAFTGAARALFLAVILPVIIKLLKPAPVQLPITPDEPLQNLSPQTHLSKKNDTTSSHSPNFDLNLARISVVLDILAFVTMIFASNGLVFSCGAALQSLGAGFSPAVQAFALDVYSRRGGKGEAGRLFGAISVVQALGSQILGPALFGFVYYKTVATFPRAIFVLTVVLMSISLALLALIHPPTTSEDDAEVAVLDDETQVPVIRVTITQEDAHVHIDEDEETEGRGAQPHR